MFHRHRYAIAALLALGSSVRAAEAQDAYYLPGANGQVGVYYYGGPRSGPAPGQVSRAPGVGSYVVAPQQAQAARRQMVRTSRKPAKDSTREVVDNPTREAPGTIVVDTPRKLLFLVQADGTAVRYRVAVGKQGFTWQGTAEIGLRAQWPSWTPPKEMLRRKPYLPRHMAGGPRNPLGARALYLFSGGRDTLLRIHGTNEPSSIGRNASSGCIRMLNKDIIDLYERAPVGTRVVVL